MWIAGISPIGGTILIVLGSAMMIAQAIVVITPTKKDDEIMGKLMSGYLGKFLRAVMKFAPFTKKL